jgi:hypothetical protein
LSADIKFIEKFYIIIGSRSPYLIWRLQYSLKFILHAGHLGMLQDMRQPFVSESNGLAKAISDYFHVGKIGSELCEATVLRANGFLF